MNFKQAVNNIRTVTTNGMPTLETSSSALVDFFYQVGAMRGQDPIPLFSKASGVSMEVALRIALWLRDARGGAGERELFRKILKHIEVFYPFHILQSVLQKVPEVGRWDDLLCLVTHQGRQYAFKMIKSALETNNGLCAKWMPRQGSVARELAEFFKMTPRQWRKYLAERTRVVETQMCEKQWDSINFSQVPSVAHSRYKKAFARNSSTYSKYLERVIDGEEKINAGAVFPYDVLKGMLPSSGNIQRLKFDPDVVKATVAQWDSLPNYVGDANILPLVDVSGSMYSGLDGNLTPIDVAVSIGLYLSEKNEGAFKDMFLTFTTQPKFVTLNGNIVDRLVQMVKAEWGGSTNIVNALDAILKVAKDNNVAQEDMPCTLLILSDMQFDVAVSNSNATLFELAKAKYAESGYEMPSVVFWNVNNVKGVPVSAHSSGTALISGCSPAIVKSVLGMEKDSFTPFNIMLKTVMVDRYNLPEVYED
jgi:hypothetical protein